MPTPFDDPLAGVPPELRGLMQGQPRGPATPGIAPGMPGGMPTGGPPPPGGAPPPGAQPNLLTQGGFEQFTQGMPQGGGATPGIAPGAGGGANNRLGMEDAMLAQLLMTSGIDDEIGALEKQQARAQALRDTALPEMRQAGRVAVAASPLEFLATGVKQYRGAMREKDIEEGKKDKVTGKRSGGLKDLRKQKADAVAKFGEKFFQKDEDETT